MTTITWNISQMDCCPEKDGLSDVVFTIHWQCNAVDSGYSGSAYGTCGVTLDPDALYIPYADLTKDTVLGWIWGSGVDKDATETLVANQIETQKNPPVVTPPLPWAS